MKKTILLGALLWGTTLSAYAVQFGPLTLSGFGKDEITTANNVGTVNDNGAMPLPCYGDAREVLPTSRTPGSQQYCLPTGAGTVTTPSPMFQLTGTLKHEFDNGVTVQGVLTKRIRSGSNDVVGQNWYEKYVAISYPSMGQLSVGTQLARAWSRQDGFSYPIGLSTAWSETGAGFGILPDAVRFTSRMFHSSYGKFTLEATYATNHAYNQYVGPQLAGPAPTPQMLELFAQFSNRSNLIEFTYEISRGAGQSSWGKNPFVGASNLPVLTVNGTNGTTTNYYDSEPVQSVAILEGDHWFTPQWMFTWGLRHSYWSGASTTCGYVTSLGPGLGGGCTYPSGGFNYAVLTSGGTPVQPGYSASTNDFLLGLSHYRGLWTYTAGMVYLGRARTDNPTQWGQDNWAVVTNLGIYRKVPEIYRNLSVYAGFGYVHFGQLGAPPLSMTSVSQFGGVNSWVSRDGESVTLGALITF